MIPAKFKLYLRITLFLTTLFFLGFFLSNKIYAQETIILRPSGPGDLTQWTASGCTANWQCVDEVNSDGEATYVESTAYSQVDLYDLPASGIPVGSTINKVSVWILARADVWGSIRFVVRTNGGDRYSAQRYPYNWYNPTKYQPFSYSYSSNPITGSPWTLSDIDNLQIGVEAFYAPQKMTQIWSIVKYTPPGYVPPDPAPAPNPPVNVEWDNFGLWAPDGAWVSDSRLDIRIRDDGPADSYPNTYHWHRIYLYLDDGDDVFDPATDALIFEETVGGAGITSFNATAYPTGGKTWSTFWDLGGYPSGQRFFWRLRNNNCCGWKTNPPPESISAWSPTYTFAMDHERPTSTINAPACPTAGSLTSLSGTAFDALAGVWGVALSIQRDSDGLWWDWGINSWGASQDWEYDIGTTSWTIDTSSVTWTDSESYTIFSRAEDDAILFTWNTESPANSLNITVGDCDLEVTLINIIPNPVTEGGGATADVTVINNGTADIGTTFQVAFCYDWDSTTGCDPPSISSPQSVTSLASEVSAVLSFTFTAPSVAGSTSFNAWAKADSGDDIPEGDETNNENTASYLVESPIPQSWVQTTVGDVGAKGMIDMDPPPDGPPEPNADYLVIADSTVTNFTSAKDWLVKNYSTSGGINTGFVSGDIYTELWEEFGRGRATDWSQSSNGDIPNNIGVYAYPSAEAINNGDTGPSQDFTWDGTGAASVDDSVVLFINGNLDITQNLSLGNKKVVFIVKGDVNVSSSSLPSTVDGLFVTNGKFNSGTNVVPPPSPATSVGYFSNILIGSSGFPIISYRDMTNGDLKFARCLNEDCSSRNLVTIAGANNVGNTSSMVLGQDNLPRIAYFDNTTDEINLVRCLDDDCENRNTTTLALANPCCSSQGHVDIAMGTDGLPRIVYINTSNQLNMIRCLDDDCENRNTTRVDNVGVSSGGTNNRLMIEINPSTGFAYIGYNGSQGAGPFSLKLARCMNADCTEQRVVVVEPSTLSAGTGQYASMALGPDNLPRFVYRIGGADPIPETKLARCLNADCTSINITVIDTGDRSGLDSAIAVGPNPGDYPVITYYDVNLFGYRYMRCLDDDCENRNRITLATGGTFQRYTTSIIVDSAGFARISYYKSGADLGYVRCTNADCSGSSTALSSVANNLTPSFTTVNNTTSSSNSSTANSTSSSTTTSSSPTTVSGRIVTTVDGEEEDGDCLECQLTVNGAVIAFGGFDLFRDLGLSNINNPSETFNFDPSYLYLFTKVDFTLGYSLLGKKISSFTELTP